MIRVRRPVEAPERLRVAGAAEARALCDAMEGDTTAWRTLEFRSAVYGHESVRGAFLAAQHHKCAFCEQRISAANEGEVEHFRPKGGWQARRGDALHQPGYYWLVYAWSNLLVTCRACNGKQHKGNLFPLEDEARRATSHHADVTAERPMFVDPATEEPSDFIRFHRHMPYAPRDNARGVATIEAFGLRRVALREQRRDLYARLRALADVARDAADEGLRGRARAALVRCAQGDAEFSAVARDFLVALGGVDAVVAHETSNQGGAQRSEGKA